MLSGVRASETRARVNEALRHFALVDERRRRIRSLTHDARIRFGLAQALLADRRVIVLDEPLDGIGTESLDLLRRLIVELRAFDRAILIASRDTAVLQGLTDRVTFLDHGRVRRIGAPRPATPANADTVFHLVIHHGAEHVAAVFPSAVSLGRGTYAVHVTVPALNRGLRDLLDRGALLTSIALVGATMAPPRAETLDEVVT
jgi:ABC-type multidrug transport system ATPase subunit